MGELLERMADYPGLVGADSDYKETRPQMRVNIDRQRAADLGISVTDIGRALETMMGSRQVTTYVDSGEEYDVMLQAGRVLSRDQLEQHLYKWGSEVSSNAVEVHIHNLRRKLRAELIETVRGVGYVARK